MVAATAANDAYDIPDCTSIFSKLCTVVCIVYLELLQESFQLQILSEGVIR